MLRLYPLLLIFLVTAPALAQDKITITFQRPLPGGGIPDREGKVGFFPNTTSGIDALDLATGRLLWVSKEAGRPLLATADRLLAQAGKTNQVRIIVLDTRNDGKRVLESDAIKFPEWVSVQTALGRSFHSFAGTDNKGPWLRWEAQAFYAGGARPTPEIEKAARKSASGVARIDLKSGKIEHLTNEQIAAGKYFNLNLGGENNKVGKLTLSVKDSSANNPKNPFQQRRVLQARNADKEIVWERDIAAPVFIPPPP